MSDQLISYSGNKTYKEDLSGFINKRENLRALYFKQYDDFGPGTIKEINDIFNYIDAVYYRYKFLAEDEAGVEYIKYMPEQHTPISLINALNRLIYEADQIINNNDSFKQETWYLKGSKGFADNKSGSFWLTEIKLEAENLLTRYSPAKPMTYAMESRRPSSTDSAPISLMSESPGFEDKKPRNSHYNKI